MIASTATADKNTLDTGTLGFSDIGNKADFKVEHQSVGISTGGNIGGQFVDNMANGLLVGANNEGHDNSTTHAAISDGTITVRDTDKQQQNVADLNRDVEHANNALSSIFDKEKEQNRLREINLIGEKGNLTPTNKQLIEQIRNTASASYGTGSDLQRAIQAATAITQQNKHIPGSNEYKIASDAGLNKSTLTAQPETLLSKLGTGQQVGKTSIGTPGSKERINYGNIIGNYIGPQTGVSTPTTNGIVHYGKNGVHVVPARPSE